MKKEQEPVSLGKFRNGHFDAKIQKIDQDYDSSEMTFEVVLVGPENNFYIPGRVHVELDSCMERGEFVCQLGELLIGEQGIFVRAWHKYDEEEKQEIPLQIYDLIDAKEVEEIEAAAVPVVEGHMKK